MSSHRTPFRSSKDLGQSTTGPTSGPARRRKTVGVLVDYLQHFVGGYEHQIRTGVEATCRRLDLNLLIAVGRPLESSDVSGSASNLLYEHLSRECLDGLILLSGSLASSCGIGAIARFCERHSDLPLCSFGIAIPGVPSVVANQGAGMQALVEHVLEDHHCRRPAFLSGPTENPDMQVRLDVFQRGLTAKGIERNPQLMVSGPLTIAGGRQATHEMIEAGASFDAVIACNDGMAVGAIDALRAHGLRVPRDVVVVGFDDLPMARTTDPPLTTVRQPLSEMAKLAVEILVDRIHGRPVPDRTELPTQLIRRRSCGCQRLVPEGQRTPQGEGVRGNPPCASSVPPPAGESVHAELAKLQQVLNDSVLLPDEVAPGWVEIFLGGLANEIAGEVDALGSALEQIFERTADHDEVCEALQRAVTVAREVLSAGDSAHLEHVWHDARIAISLFTMRFQSRRRIEIDQHYLSLVGTGERFSSARDLDSLKRILAEDLPKVEVRTASICQYVGTSHLELEPFFCLRDGVPFDPGVSRFPSANLLAPGLDTGGDRHTFFAVPLVADSEPVGVAVFDFGSGSPLFELLRNPIGTALRDAALHKEIEQKSAAHERSVQERIATSKRLEALSVLAGGVAHDLNNAFGPLAVLPGIVLDEVESLCSPDALARSSIREDLHTIDAASVRATQTIKDLLTLGRIGRANKEPVDLNQVARNAMAITPSRFVENTGHLAEVTMDLCAAPLVVMGSESHLVRAVANLVRNGVEALTAPGSVVVQTRRVSLSHPLSGYEQVDPGDYAVLAVSDTGQGIANLDIGRIFEPFFTKKMQSPQHGSGSGLGLAIVHGVVKEHDGFVDVTSTVGRGTTFALYFPSAQVTIKPHETPSIPPCGRARILVVDDDPLQLRAIRRVLSRLGHKVTTLESGSDAYELFVRLKVCSFEQSDDVNRQRPDLIVFDILLNEEHDGLDMFERIRQLFPDQKGIVVSGHPPTEKAELAIEKGLIWLGKPYNTETLTSAVEEALGTVNP